MIKCRETKQILMIQWNREGVRQIVRKKKFKLSFVVVSLTISIEPIFFKYQPNNGIFRSSFLRINMGYCKGAWSINVSSKD